MNDHAQDSFLPTYYYLPRYPWIGYLPCSRTPLSRYGVGWRNSEPFLSCFFATVDLEWFRPGVPAPISSAPALPLLRRRGSGGTGDLGPMRYLHVCFPGSSELDSFHCLSTTMRFYRAMPKHGHIVKDRFARSKDQKLPANATGHMPGLYHPDILSIIDTEGDAAGEVLAVRLVGAVADVLSQGRLRLVTAVQSTEWDLAADRT